MIHESAFAGVKPLHKVSFLGSPTAILKGAFAESGLADITLPNSVTAIGDEAFHYCRSLPSIMLPSALDSIGSFAFADCDSLTSVIVPDSVQTVGAYAFAYNNLLASLTLGSDGHASHAELRDRGRDDLLLAGRHMPQRR